MPKLAYHGKVTWFYSLKSKQKPTFSKILHHPEVKKWSSGGKSVEEEASAEEASAEASKEAGEKRKPEHMFRDMKIILQLDLLPVLQEFKKLNIKVMDKDPKRFADAVKNLRQIAKKYTRVFEDIEYLQEKREEKEDAGWTVLRQEVGRVVGRVKLRNPIASVEFKWIEELDREVHKYYITYHVIRMLEKQYPSGIIPIVAANEINSGVKELSADLTSSLKLEKGPKMISSGGSSHGQKEFYPVAYRQTDAAKLAYQDYFVVKSSGDIRKSSELEKDQQDPNLGVVPWDKNASEAADVSYRPIVVHEFKIGEQLIWIGSVHTSPFGDEFHREKVFSEIEKPLKALIDEAKIRNIPLMVGGDFYLTAEAAVEGSIRGRDYQKGEGSSAEDYIPVHTQSQRESGRKSVKRKAPSQMGLSNFKKSKSTPYETYLGYTLDEAKEKFAKNNNGNWATTRLHYPVKEIDFIRNIGNIGKYQK